MLYVAFAENEAKPFVELTSRIQTRNRVVDWTQKPANNEDAATLHDWTQPTSLLPFDGIVLKTAQEATHGARTDVEKAQKLYDWVVSKNLRRTQGARLWRR